VQFVLSRAISETPNKEVMATSIPKILHFCWFSEEEYPALVKKCMESWVRNCPDFKIVKWNLENFDVNMARYSSEAYSAGKFTFLSDFVRLYALYEFGGVYADSDVEILKPLDRFLSHGGFIGFESLDALNPAFWGCEPKHPIVGKLLEVYSSRAFLLEDGSLDLTPMPAYITPIISDTFGLKRDGSYQVLDGDFHVYPQDYFSPKDLQTGKVRLTPNSYAVHHFAGSWLPSEAKIYRSVLWMAYKFLGEGVTDSLRDIRRKIIRFFRN